MSKYNDYTKEELIKHMETLEKQLKSNKFGLYWDKNIEKEEALKQLGENVPMLVQNDELSILEDKDSNLSHLLIEGDNLHALSALEMLNNNSEGLVDVIYIDPPYNTGRQDFIYNDKFVDKEDGYKHSKWLNFMEPRLRLSKRLLTNRGVIFISIDDHEHAHLRLLMDEIYGEKNFIGNFIWKTYRAKNNSKTVNDNFEYIVCYANKREVVENDIDAFRIKKNGYDETIKLVSDLKNKNKTTSEIEIELRKFYRANGYKGISAYNKLDANFLIYREISMDAPGKNGPMYDILHPATGLPVKIPKNGWRFKEDTVKTKIINNEVVFGKDHTTIPRSKKLLTDVETEVQGLVYDNTKSGDETLQEIFGPNKVFDYPKPIDLIEYLIKSFSKDSVILDFFAGSGTLGHAVLELNKEDNGNRKFIMITNNEGNIMRGVTQPRINTIVTGIRPDGSKYSDGIPSNVKFYETKLIERTDDEISDRDKISEYMADMISIKEEVFNIKDIYKED